MLGKFRVSPKVITQIRGEECIVAVSLLPKIYLKKILIIDIKL